jgi:hypothetical protein
MWFQHCHECVDDPYIIIIMALQLLLQIAWQRGEPGREKHTQRRFVPSLSCMPPLNTQYWPAVPIQAGQGGRISQPLKVPAWLLHHQPATPGTRYPTQCCCCCAHVACVSAAVAAAAAAGSTADSRDGARCPLRLPTCQSQQHRRHETIQVRERWPLGSTAQQSAAWFG